MSTLHLQGLVKAGELTHFDKEDPTLSFKTFDLFDDQGFKVIVYVHDNNRLELGEQLIKLGYALKGITHELLVDAHYVTGQLMPSGHECACVDDYRATLGCRCNQ